MATTTDQYARVLFQDGGGIDTDDLNGAASRGLAVLWDQVIRELIPNRAIATAANEDTQIDMTAIPYALALTTMGARPVQGTTFQRVRITRGTLMQAIVATPTGAEPAVLGFSFSGNDELIIAAGDPSNPRVDLIQMKLEYVEDTAPARYFEDAVSRAKTTVTANTRRRVKCTLSLKQGTPGASPVYPTPDTGCCVIAGLVVGAGWVNAFQPKIADSAGAELVIHDQRMPLRVRGHVTPPSNFVAEFLGGRARQINNFSVVRDTVTVDAVAANIVAPLMVAGNRGRLVQVSAMINTGTSLNSWLIRYVGGSADAGATPNIRLNNAGLDGPGAAPAPRLTPDPLAFQTQHNPDTGPTVQAAANGMGPPVWTNGFRSPAQAFTGEFDVVPPIENSLLAISWINPPNNADIRWTTFYVAEGL